MPNTPKTPTKSFPLHAAAAFAATLAVLFALLLVAYAVPGGPVRANIVRSVPLLQNEGLYPEFFGFKLFQMDNYTDTVMLFEAASADETAPITAMMTNTAYNVDNFETLPDDLAAYLAGESTATLTPFCYARYWHGYMIWLRPLLLLFTYGQIRVVLYLVFAVLAALVLAGLKKHCGTRAAVWFAVSQLLTTAFFAPHQLQFFTTFAIGYAGCVWVLAKPRKAEELCVGLVALGTATAFCDLLVTPLLTLGLPLTVWLLRPEQRLRGGWAQCLPVVSGALGWGTGYGLCWASKWVLASLITGSDIIGDAIRQIGVRTTGDSWHGIELTWGNILNFIYATLQSKHLFWPLAVLALLCVAVFVSALRSKQALVRAVPLALVAVMPLVWFAVLRNHSIQHGWFTWRILGVTLFAGSGFLYYSCSIKAIGQKLSRKTPPPH